MENTKSETTGQKPTKHCLVCATELNDKNWYVGFQENKTYRCIPCTSKYQERINHNRMFVNGKYIPRSHPLWKPGRYKSWAEGHSYERLESVKPGYVYIITNPAWPEWIKVGMAVDADDRCNGYQTGSPFRDYEVIYSFETEDRRSSERDAHTLLEQFAEDRRGEWFKIDTEYAIDLLSTIHEDI